MGLEDSIKQLKFDNRMTDWNLRQGKLSEAELKAHLDSLEDCEANAVKLDIGESSKASADFAEPAQEQQPAATQDFNNTNNGNPYGSGSSDSGSGFGGSFNQ